MSVLPDYQITALARAGVIVPFDEAMVQPSSYDVKLGSTFWRFRDDAGGPLLIDPMDQECLNQLMRKEEPPPDTPVLLGAGEFMLAVTKEVVDVPHDLVCRLEGKSSLGRLGQAVHITAGYIDPGFKGAITLEMVNMAPKPILFYPGMPIAQIGFISMLGRARKAYSGRYQGDEEATPSRYGVSRTYGGLTDPDGFGN